MRDKGKVRSKGQRPQPGHIEPLPLLGGGSGWTPQDLQRAYALPSQSAGQGRVVGIIDAYDNPNVESDLATYRSNYNLGPCTTGNGCFRKFAQDGSVNYPATAPANTAWGPEIALDVEMVSATCPKCSIVLVEANSDSIPDALTAVSTAISKGANAISMSFAASEFPGDGSYDSHFSNSAVTFLAGAGDWGYGTAWPAISKNVIAVGGTNLEQDQNGNFFENAWSGTGSGCSQYGEPKPTWQSDTGCSYRMMNDVSMVAGTSVSAYSTYAANGWPSGWLGAAGTSVATPLAAGVVMLAPVIAGTAGALQGWYANGYAEGALSMYDVTSGSNGTCPSSTAYFCTAATGYDGPTGMGSPLGAPAEVAGRSPSNTFGGTNKGTAPAICSHGDPVVCATGDLFETATDLSIPGRGRALSFARTYNAMDAATASQPDALGWGWTDSYAMSLSFDQSTGAVTVHQEDGATVTFYPQGSSYVAPEFVTAQLAHNGDGTYTYTLADQTSDTFDANGVLLSESDRNGYVTTLGYLNGKLATVTDPAGRQLTIHYNANGQLDQVSDGNGHTVAYGYDPSGNLQTVTDPNAAVTTYGYDSAHRLTSVTDPDNRGSVTNTYDPSNRVIAQKDQLLHETDWSYQTNSSGTTTTTITLPMHGQVVNGHTLNDQIVEKFNSYGELISETKGAGSSDAGTWSYTYDPPTGGVITATDPNGHTSVMSWDGQGNQLSVTDPLNHTTSSTYDARNNRRTLTDALNVTTTYGYDANGNLTSVSTPLLNSSGQTIATRVTSYGYDPNQAGDVTSITDPDGKIWRNSYDGHGDLSTVTDPLGNTTTYCYNAIGWRTASISPRGTETCANPGPFTTTYSYDPDGRLKGVTDPDNHPTSTLYYPSGDVKQTTDGNNNVTTYTYDAAHEQTSVTRADQSAVQTHFDLDGRMSAQIDGATNTTTYTYDEQGRLRTMSTPPTSACSGPCTTTYGYDPAGNRTSLLDPNARTTTFGYDNANRLSTISYSDPATHGVSIGYDADGRRTTMSDATGTSSWVWDSLGRLTSYTNGAGSVVTYGYDLKGQTTSIGYPDAVGSVTRGYDDAGNLHTVTDWLGHTTSFGYDPSSNLTSELYPNGTSSSRQYDNANLLTNISDAPTANPTSPFASFAYTRDGNAQVKTDTASSGFPSHSYGYSPLNQLTTVDSSSYGYDQADNLAQLLNGTTQTFNAAGELTTSTAPITPVTHGSASDALGTATSLTASFAAVLPRDQILVTTTTHDSVNVATPNGYTLVGSHDGVDHWKITIFRKTAVGGENQVAVSYSDPSNPGPLPKTLVVQVYRNVDPINPIDAFSGGDTKSATTLTEDVTAPSVTTSLAGDRLVLALAATSVQAVVGTWTLPQGMNEQTHVSASGAWTMLSTIADQPGGAAGATGDKTATYHQTASSLEAMLVALRTTPQPILYYYQDQLGNTRALTDNFGNVVSATSYDPYGNTSVSTSTPGVDVTNPMGFGGGYTDAESGLIYLINRSYDPATGQFLSRDPLAPLTKSSYGYVSGNPLNLTDPNGLGFCLFGHDSNGSCAGSSLANDLDVVATALSAAAFYVDARGLGTFASALFGFASVVTSWASAISHCVYGSFVNCLKAIAVAAIASVAAGLAYYLGQEGVVVAGLSPVLLRALQLIVDVLATLVSGISSPLNPYDSASLNAKLTELAMINGECS